VGGHRFDPRAVDRDEAELRRDEQPVREKENQNGDEAERGTDAPTLVTDWANQVP
jgi:hypothetical protein